MLAHIHHRWLVNGAVGLMLLGLGAATVARNQVYGSQVGYWEDAAAKSPGKARVFNNLGYVYQQAGRYGEARSAYQRAIELDPVYWKAHINLATVPEEKGDAPIQ